MISLTHRGRSAHRTASLGPYTHPLFPPKPGPVFPSLPPRPTYPLTRSASPHLPLPLSLPSGIDISRGALAYAQRKYTKDALFCFGDIKEPFSFIPTDSFDVSFSYGVLGYTNAPESCATLRELVRVTKPGGGIFFNTQEPDCPSYSWGQGKQRRLWRRCLRGVDVKIEIVPEFELRRGQSVNRPLAYCPHHTTAVFIRKSRPLALPPGYRSAPRGRGGSGGVGGGVGGIDGGSSVGGGGGPTAGGVSSAAHQLRTSRPSLSGKDWREHIDKRTGATYYHNFRTQKTQWDFPYADAAMASKGDGVDAASNAATMASAAAGGFSPMLRSAMVFLPGVVDNAFFRALARLALDVATSGRTTATLAAPVIVVDGGRHGFSFVDVLELSPSLQIPSSASSSSSSSVWGVSEVTSVHEEHPEHLRYEVNFTLIDGSTVMALFEHVQDEGRCRPAALNGITNHTLVVAGGYTREDRVFQRGISVVDRRDHLSILLLNKLPPMPPVSPPSSASFSSSSSKRHETPPKVPESEHTFRMHESEWTRANDDVRRYPMKDRVDPLKDIEFILHTPDGRSTELAPYFESVLLDELGLWALATNWPEYQTSDVNRLRWPMWAPGEYTVEMVDSRSNVPLQANAATESADIIVGDGGEVSGVVSNQGPDEGPTQQFMPSREPLCTTRFTVVENSMEANSEEAMLEAVKRYWRLTYVHYSPSQQPGHI